MLALENKILRLMGLCSVQGRVGTLPPKNCVAFSTVIK